MVGDIIKLEMISLLLKLIISRRNRIYEVWGNDENLEVDFKEIYHRKISCSV